MDRRDNKQLYGEDLSDSVALLCHSIHEPGGKWNPKRKALMG